MDTEMTDTEVSGNTNTSTQYRHRCFQLTLNQVDKYQSLKNEFLKLKSCKYFVASLEKAPTTGHQHIHIYAHFDNPYKLNQKIMSHGAHVVLCKASPQVNIAYVKKDGEILDEWGVEPHQGNPHTVKELASINDPSDLSWREYNTWLKVKSAPKKIKKDNWLKQTDVYFIWGPSGVGKTQKAQELADDEFEEVKYVNDFWNGVVDGNGCAIYDDWRDSHMKASEFINFIDYRSHNLNVKGGNVRNNYTKIIITSVQDPHYIYKNIGDEPRAQWLRRLKIINLGDNDSDISPI